MFKPAGEKARWRIAYELFQKADYGDLVQYWEIGTALNLDADNDRHIIQMAARRATIQLERVEGRTTVSVTNRGYKIAKPGDHLGIGRSRNKRAGRQLDRGENVTNGVDLNLVDSETRKALMTLARGFAVQRDVNRRVADIQQRHGRAIELLFDRVERLENRELEN
jgi:hypothetical protein